MTTYPNAPRLLGAAFLIVIVTSLIAGIFGLNSGTTVSPDGVSDQLVSISNNLDMMHISILGGMLNATSIVFLAVLLYIVLSSQDKVLALVALGLWLAEAVFYAIMQIGTLALIPLSQEFVRAGAPANSFYQVLGEFLYNGINGNGLAIHMWFYCAGGLLWYYLFYRSQYVPRAISLFGILAVILGLAGIAFQLIGYSVPIYVYLPIGLFELIIGIWLVLKGIEEPRPAAGQAG